MDGSGKSQECTKLKEARLKDCVTLCNLYEMPTKGKSTQTECRLLSGPRVLWGQMVRGSESVLWVSGNVPQPDSSGLSSGHRNTEQVQSSAPVWGKGCLLSLPHHMSSQLQCSEQRPSLGLFVFFPSQFYQPVAISFWQKKRGPSPFSISTLSLRQYHLLGYDLKSSSSLDLSPN